MYFEYSIFVHFVEPYSPTGNFQVDFCELCTRAGFPTMQVIPRPHRPPTPSSIPQDSTPIGRQEKKDGMVFFLCNQYVWIKFFLVSCSLIIRCFVKYMQTYDWNKLPLMYFQTMDSAFHWINHYPADKH